MVVVGAEAGRAAASTEVAETESGVEPDVVVDGDPAEPSCSHSSAWGRAVGEQCEDGKQDRYSSPEGGHLDWSCEVRVAAAALAVCAWRRETEVREATSLGLEMPVLLPSGQYL